MELLRQVLKPAFLLSHWSTSALYCLGVLRDPSQLPMENKRVSQERLLVLGDTDSLGIKALQSVYTMDNLPVSNIIY